jgi:hypothetical protein
VLNTIPPYTEGRGKGAGEILNKILGNLLRCSSFKSIVHDALFNLFLNIMIVFEKKRQNFI